MNIHLRGQEFFGIIIDSIESIIDDVFPLQYQAQQQAIQYIIDHLHDEKIPESTRQPQINQEILSLSNTKQKFYNYVKERETLSEKELEQILPQIYKAGANEVRQSTLTKINYKIDLLNGTELPVLEKRYASIEEKDKEEWQKEYDHEKEYITKLQNSQSLAEQDEIIENYKSALKQQYEQTKRILQEQETVNRIGKPTDNVELHKLVKNGILTKEEIAPMISNYQLLNTLAEFNIHDGEVRVKKLFDAARKFYPDDPAKGLLELGNMDYHKTSDLLGKNVLTLVEKKIISFAYMQYMENNKLGIINAMGVQTLKYLISLGIALDQLLSINSDELKLFFQLTKNEPRIKGLIEMGLDIKQLLDMEADQQKFFIENTSRIKGLIEMGLDIKQLLDMEVDQQKFFIENTSRIKGLIEMGLDIKQLLDMEADQQKFFIENTSRIKGLIEMGLDIKQLLDMEVDQQKFFIENTSRIKGLIEMGLDIKQLLDMEADQQKFFIENTSRIKGLIEMGLDIKQLFDMEADQQKFFIENTHRIKGLIEMGLDIKQLLDMEVDQQKFFIENTSRIKGLIDTGFDIKQLFDMEADQQKFFIENALVDHTKIYYMIDEYNCNIYNFLDISYDMYYELNKNVLNYDMYYKLNKIYVDNSDESNVVIDDVLSVLGDLAA